MHHGERPPLVLQLLFLGKHLGYLMERRLAARGLNRTQAIVLTALRHCPGLRAQELCAPARVEPANVSRTLQSLERLGLLERHPHPTDGRASVFYLTSGGRSLAAELSDEVKRLSAELLREVPPEDQARLERTLGTLWGAVGAQLATAGHRPPALDPVPRPDDFEDQATSKLIAESRGLIDEP